jgi:adenosylmethionine-8-amino-7-oxononanoate aminotransferase
MSRQAKELDQILFAPHEHPVALELSSKLLSFMGKPFSKVFYTDDGSTAVEAALKMVLQYHHLKGQKERKKFLSIDLAYHGDTLGAVSVGHLSEFHHYFDRIGLETFKSTAPYCYRCPLGKTYPACELACLHHAEQLIEKQGHEIAALIVEPLILGASGHITYPSSYLEKLMRLCQKKEILIIFDEVFTGFGRTGTLFAYNQISLKPDLVCLSKGLTSGMLPLGAVVTTQEVFEPFTGAESRKFYHGHTCSGNAIACAVALESLCLLEDNDALQTVRNWAPLMQAQKQRFSELPHVGDARTLGSIWAIELVQDKKTKEPFASPSGPGWKIAEKLWESGYWIRPIGSVLYTVPPYSTTQEELKALFEVLYSQVSNHENFTNE